MKKLLFTICLVEFLLVPGLNCTETDRTYPLIRSKHVPVCFNPHLDQVTDRILFYANTSEENFLIRGDRFIIDPRDHPSHAEGTVFHLNFLNSNPAVAIASVIITDLETNAFFFLKTLAVLLHHHKCDDHKVLQLNEQSHE